jgi:hypothetical protein
MQFVLFQEDNKKENETLFTFLPLKNNEEELLKLSDIIKSADTSELHGDYSIFHLHFGKQISQFTVNEMCQVSNLLNNRYGPLFSVCYGKFTFPFDEFKDLSSLEIASKLDEKLFACQIEKYFSGLQSTNKIDKKSFNNIFEAWNNNESSSDIYHMILVWINENNRYITDYKCLEIINDIKKRMENNDETNDIVEDFIMGYKYHYLRKSIGEEKLRENSFNPIPNST